MAITIKDTQLKAVYNQMTKANQTVDDSSVLKVLAAVADASGKSSTKMLAALSKPGLTQKQQLDIAVKGMSAGEKKDLCAILDEGKLKLSPTAKTFLEAVVGRGPLTPPKPPDVVDPTPSTTPSVVVYDRSKDQILQTYAPNWKGDFNIPGKGAGNVGTGRDFNGTRDATNVLVNCDLMDKNLLDFNLESATMVVGPKGAKDQASFVEVPMGVATAPGYTSWNRGGGSHTIPDKKFLSASIDTASLAKLAKGGDLEFYMRLQTKDGQTIWINKDGQPFRNFQINASELQPRGDI